MALSKGLVALMFFVHASAMVTLPFASFFLTREYLISQAQDKKDYSITVWSVFASVVTIFTILISYVIIAFLDDDNDQVTKESDSHSKKE